MADPCGVAVIGASERTLWTHWVLSNLESYGYPGPIWLINPRRAEVYGRSCLPNIAALPGVPECGVIIVGGELAPTMCAELAALGTPTVVVISDGFRESGTADGAAIEAELADAARRTGVRVIGPNCVGYANFPAALCAIAEPIPLEMPVGEVSLVSQSGALIASALGSLSAEGHGCDVVYSIGNGTVFGLEEALHEVTNRPATRIVCGVVEAIRDRPAVEQAVRAGARRGQEFVFVLLGQSAGARQVAASHTGAIIGDQRVLRSWLESIGVTVVESLNELARVVSLVRRVGRPDPSRGMFIVTASGGAAGLAADAAERHGLPLAAPDPTTLDTVGSYLTPGNRPGNPLDLTARGTSGRRAVYDALCADQAIGLLLEPYQLAWPDGSPGREWHRRGLEALAGAVSDGAVPAVLSSVFQQTPTSWINEFGARPGIAVVGDLDTTLAALARLYGVGSGSAGTSAVHGSSAAKTGDVGDGLVGEAQGRRVLRSAGIPMVAGRTAVGRREVLTAVGELRPPWAIKLALPELGHRSRVGGVRVGLCSTDDVRRVIGEIEQAAGEAGLQVPESAPFLVQEMAFGPELLVGLVRDRIVGPSVTVGVGGWSAEAGAMLTTLLLPTDVSDITHALTGNGLGRLLGHGGTIQIAKFLADIGAAFTNGPLREYTVVECNPVILDSAGPMVADVMLVR